MKQKFYLYEPMLKIYEKYVSKAAEKATTQKWLNVLYWFIVLLAIKNAHRGAWTHDH